MEGIIDIFNNLLSQHHFEHITFDMIDYSVTNSVGSVFGGV